VLVVDASVVAPAIADGGRDGDACRARIKGQVLAAPDLLRLETMSVLRRQLANRSLTSEQATNALDDLLDLPLVVYPTAPLLRRGWEVRDNITAYDRSRTQSTIQRCDPTRRRTAASAASRSAVSNS